VARKKLTKKEKEAQRKRIAERDARRDAMTDFNNPHQVMTVPQWARLNNVSVTQAKRVIKAGEGPPVMQLSKNRKGIRVSDNTRWQEARLKTAKQAQHA
jgi:hypothetical protein